MKRFILDYEAKTGTRSLQMRRAYNAMLQGGAKRSASGSHSPSREAKRQRHNASSDEEESSSEEESSDKDYVDEIEGLIWNQYEEDKPDDMLSIIADLLDEAADAGNPVDLTNFN
ncbi:MAG: hypothetical protein CMD33_03955, partial [Flavobacteriales bacterium]|nr:hypothetical protein [Flavobacteriales bacterium]